MILPGNHGWVGTTSTRLCTCFFLSLVLRGQAGSCGSPVTPVASPALRGMTVWHCMTIYHLMIMVPRLGGWCTPAPSCPSLDERTPKWRTLLEHCKRYPDIPIHWHMVLTFAAPRTISLAIPQIGPTDRSNSNSSARDQRTEAQRRPGCTGSHRWGNGNFDFNGWSHWNSSGIQMGSWWDFHGTLRWFYWDFDGILILNIP
jgi:hypothetical protein